MLFFFFLSFGFNFQNQDMVSFPDHYSFLHFSSTFDDDHHDHDQDQDPSFFLQQQPQNDIFVHQFPLLNELPSTLVTNLPSNDQNYMIMEQHHHHHQQIQRSKRASSSKRDRHSKINTLRGPRDRRMRLSLPVAKDFFGLQDMLGFDKPSKTVEWLLFQSRQAIKKLSMDHHHGDDVGDHHTRSPSLVSDGEEVVSGIDETTTVCGTKEGRNYTTTKEKRGRSTRKTTFHPLARECREKARARARARTREKQLQTSTTTTTSKQDDVSKISSSWSTQMETNGDHQQLSRSTRSNYNQGIIIDDCLMNMGRWSPSSNSIYNGSPQEMQPFGDHHFQYFGKPWEPYNNHGIC